MKKNIKRLILVIFLGIGLVSMNYAYISYKSMNLIFISGDEIPKSKYALLLGTPKFLPSGKVNNYYKNRIESASQLYANNKISKIIINVDTLNKYEENEVKLIKEDLISIGVHQQDIILDNYGDSTWNSITNLNKKIKETKITIVSQKFHLERALYISKKKNINTFGFIAKGEISNQLWIREILARVKMQLDFTRD